MADVVNQNILNEFIVEELSLNQNWFQEQFNNFLDQVQDFQGFSWQEASMNINELQQLCFNLRLGCRQFGALLLDQQLAELEAVLQHGQNFHIQSMYEITVSTSIETLELINEYAQEIFNENSRAG